MPAQAGIHTFNSTTGGIKMFTWFMKKTKFLKLMIITVIVQFIFSSIPAFAYKSLDNLRTKSVVSKDGGVVGKLARDILDQGQKDGGKKILVSSNMVSLLEGAMTQGYNIENAMLQKADAVLYNHSEPRARLEQAMGDMLGNLLRTGKKLYQVQGKEEEAKIKTQLQASYTKALKTTANLDVEKLSESDKTDVLSWFEQALSLINKTDEYQNKEIETLSRSIVNKIVNVQLKELIKRSTERNYVFAQTVLCVGETKEQYDANRTNEILSQDLIQALKDITLEQAERIGLRIAYEARWVIGKGVIPDEVFAKVDAIQGEIKLLVQQKLGKQLGVDYGASVNKDNVERVVSLKNVDGVLMGGAAKTVKDLEPVVDKIIVKAAELKKNFNIGMNWKAETQKTGLESSSKIGTMLSNKDLSNVKVVVHTSQVAEVKKQMVKAEAAIEAKKIITIPAKAEKEVQPEEPLSPLDQAYVDLIGKFNTLGNSARIALDAKETEVVLSKFSSVSDTETFTQLSRIINRLTSESQQALKSKANPEILKRIQLALKPINIFVSAGNALIFRAGGFKQYLDQWEPGTNIVAIKSLSGAKAFSVEAFVANNNALAGAFSRYQVPGLRYGKYINVGGIKIGTLIVPQDLNLNRPEMTILYFDADTTSTQAVLALRKLGIDVDVAAEYGPGKEGGAKFQPNRIREFIKLGIPVVGPSPVNKDGIKDILKKEGFNNKIAFKEALYTANRDKVTANTWVVDTLSCTSNAMVSAIYAIHKALGIESGTGLTVHSQTDSNTIFPMPSKRAREPIDEIKGFSINNNIQPASTGAAKNLFKILPELEGKFKINAVRTGTISGSFFTITMNLKKDVDVNKVKQVLRDFALNKSNGMVKFYEGEEGVSNYPLDSNSIVGWSSVSILDGFLINVLDNKRTIEIEGFYDNESAAPGQMLSRWAPWMVNARRINQILTPAPVHVQGAKELSNLAYMSTMGEETFKGKKTLIRMDWNVSGEQGEFKSTKKLFDGVETTVYPLKNGAKTVVVVSHNGRPDGKVKKEYSMERIAKAYSEALKEKGYDYKVVFHAGSITEKGLAKGLKQKIVPGAINILEDTRFFEGEEGSDAVFAAGLADLVDNEIFIFDAFGAAERKGGSLDLVANFVDEAGLGLIMEKEYRNLQEALENLYGVMLGGGPKLSEKLPMLQKVISQMKKNGFIMVGSAPAPAFLKAMHNIDIGVDVSKNLDSAKEIIDLAKQHNQRILVPSDYVMVDRDLTQKADGSESSWIDLRKLPPGANIYRVSLEQLQQGTFTINGKTLNAKQLFPYDIGERTVKEFSDTLLSTPQGLWNIWNGAFGVNEMPEFEAGSKGVSLTYKQAKEKGIKTGMVGSDTGAMAEQFGITEYVTFVSTGGSSALAFMQGKELLVMDGLKKAVTMINIAKVLEAKPASFREYVRLDNSVFKETGGNQFDDFVNTGKSQAGKEGTESAPRAVILNPDFFKLGGSTRALLKVTELLNNNFKIGLYGESAAKIQTLLGGNKNIVIAPTLDSLMAKLLSESGIKTTDVVLLRPRDEKVNLAVKQILFSERDISTIILAKAVSETIKTEGSNKALDKFYSGIKDKQIIPDATYEKTKQAMITPLKDLEILDLPEIRVTERVVPYIAQDAEKVKTFASEFVTKV